MAAAACPRECPPVPQPLRGLRDRWREGDTRSSRSWAARAGLDRARGKSTKWRLRHAIFWAAGSIRALTPEAWTAPCRRVARGGSWNNKPENCPLGQPQQEHPGKRNNNLGFGSPGHFPPEPGDHGFAGRAFKRPGPFMMSRMRLSRRGAHCAALALGDARAPAGAARRFRIDSYRSLVNFGLHAAGARF